MLTQKDLKAKLDYNPETGDFIWKIKARGIKYQSIAGTTRRYIHISVNGVIYYAHRLAWLYVYGQFPTLQIDHINGIPTDNRICNLRDVSITANKRNYKISKANTSGVIGVTWNQQYGKWQAQICVDRKNIILGRFSDFNDAVKAREEASIKYGFHQNHGRKSHSEVVSSSNSSHKLPQRGGLPWNSLPAIVTSAPCA